jgi:hypothetical protein
MPIRRSHLRTPGQEKADGQCSDGSLIVSRGSSCPRTAQAGPGATIAPRADPRGLALGRGRAAGAEMQLQP